MTEVRSEETTLHTRLMKCTLLVDESRAYWAEADVDDPVTVDRAFSGYWFGAKSTARIEVLLSNMRVRFDVWPEARWVLHRWRNMSPDVRRLVCHWHLQLADPLYRAFTGEMLATRRERPNAQISRDIVVRWVGDVGKVSWTMASRVQFASKLLSAAAAAGLVDGNRDPRPLTLPRVPDEALVYLLYLLRTVAFEGTLWANPYLRSVGIDEAALTSRLRPGTGVHWERQADLRALHWEYPDLRAWASAAVLGGAE